MTEVDRNGLEVLSADECLQLLAGATIGRIAITSGALPMILPINFRLGDGQILFRTGAGTKLDAATQNAVVAFEVDDFDPMYHSGWSVVVTGIAREVVPAPDDPVAQATPRWVGGDDRFVGISLDRVTGRRLDGGARS